MSEDDTEQIEQTAIEDADLEFTWEEAVARAKVRHYYVESGQLKLGKLASKVQTRYGEESLRNFAKETEIPFETIKRYRSVWRAWESEDGQPIRYSVARALARLPDKVRVFNRLVEERGEEEFVTEDAAIKAAKEYRQERSAGRYSDFVLHRIVSLICRKLGTIARMIQNLLTR